MDCTPFVSPHLSFAKVAGIYSRFSTLSRKQNLLLASEARQNPLTGVCLLPLLDEFRTLNWAQIKTDIEFSRIFELFPMMTLQN